MLLCYLGPILSALYSMVLGSVLCCVAFRFPKIPPRPTKSLDEIIIWSSMSEQLPHV